jgi:dihydrofolate reductase
MTLIRGYMAMSLDGYIADVDGGYGFLGRYDGVDYGFGGFFGEIGTCVFGRATWDQAAATPNALSFFKGARPVVVTSRPLAEAPADVGPVEVWDRGVGPDLVAHLRAATGGDVWIVGGGKLQSAFFTMDAIDRLEACIIPVLLGDGIPMFPKAAPRERWLELTDIRRFDLGGVILDYRRPAAP